MIKRQKYHLEPDRGLLNDPNGLVFYKDMYHVFFQWNRFEKNHSYKEWGHFTSSLELGRKCSFAGAVL